MKGRSSTGRRFTRRATFGFSRREWIEARGYRADERADDDEDGASRHPWMADSPRRLGSCSLDLLAQLFQEILKMQSQKSVSIRKASSGRGCVTCNDTEQGCSQCRLAAPAKRRSDAGQLPTAECFQDDDGRKRSKRAKVESIQLKKDLKENCVGEQLESMRIRAELVGDLGSERDRLGTLESLRGDVIFVLEGAEADGAFHENQSHRFVLVSPDIYFS